MRIPVNTLESLSIDCGKINQWGLRSCFWHNHWRVKPVLFYILLWNGALGMKGLPSTVFRGCFKKVWEPLFCCNKSVSGGLPRMFELWLKGGVGTATELPGRKLPGQDKDARPLMQEHAWQVEGWHGGQYSHRNKRITIIYSPSSLYSRYFLYKPDLK